MVPGRRVKVGEKRKAREYGRATWHGGRRQVRWALTVTRLDAAGSDEGRRPAPWGRLCPQRLGGLPTLSRHRGKGDRLRDRATAAGCGVVRQSRGHRCDRGKLRRSPAPAWHPGSERAEAGRS